MLIDFKVAMGNSSANLSQLHEARRTNLPDQDWPQGVQYADNSQERGNDIDYINHWIVFWWKSTGNHIFNHERWGVPVFQKQPPPSWRPWDPQVAGWVGTFTPYAGNLTHPHLTSTSFLVGGFNHLEKYKRQWKGWHPIYYGRKTFWNHQPAIYSYGFPMLGTFPIAEVKKD